MIFLRNVGAIHELPLHFGNCLSKLIIPRFSNAKKSFEKDLIKILDAELFERIREVIEQVEKAEKLNEFSKVLYQLRSIFCKLIKMQLIFFRGINSRFPVNRFCLMICGRLGQG